MKTQRSAQHPPLGQQDVPKFAGEAERLTWCRAIGLGTVLAVSAGCPGAQLRPPRPAACPASAIEAMRAHGLKEYTSLSVTFGDYLNPPRLWQGRVEGWILRLGGSFGPPANLPVGTRIFGELWTEAVPELERGDAYMRFDRVRLPSGEEFPVCIHADWDGDIFAVKPEPGVIQAESEYPSIVVYEWPAGMKK